MPHRREIGIIATLALTLSGCASPTRPTNTNTSAPPAVVNQPPPASQTIEPAVPMLPQSGTLTSRRPTLVVKNAVASTPAMLDYAFEVSRHPDFDFIVASGTALESVGRTSFVPAIELPPVATFYWRARVTDKVTGISSLSATSSFTTAVMNDGNYRYDLWIQMPASCQSRFETSRFVFDDNLAVSGSSVTFGPAGGYGPFGNAFPGGVTVVLQQTGSTLNGTIVGSSRPRNAAAGTLWIASSPLGTTPVATLALADERGGLSGEFSGAVFGGDSTITYLTCPHVSGVRWTLTPHQ